MKTCVCLLMLSLVFFHSIFISSYPPDCIFSLISPSPSSACACMQGERCSYTVQMWAYHMRGLQHDLYTYLPVEFFLLREEILVGVLGACLSHLASRYSLICPSPQRMDLAL